ncbi:hypothetical protein O1L55_03640 [Streptomyces albulus]|nr:hypothetical protein [Streptomyces noursei]
MGMHRRPQIGRASCRCPAAWHAIILLNASLQPDEMDEQYEGCLFFRRRGLPAPEDHRTTALTGQTASA